MKLDYVQASGYIQPLIEANSLANIANECYNYLSSLTYRSKGRCEYFAHTGFDAIAVTGMSATIIGSIVAHKLYKNIIIVRKINDNKNNSHSNFDVEGLKNQRYIFIDDLVHSGGTLNNVIKGCSILNCKIIGAYMWQSPEFNNCLFYNNVKNLRYIKWQYR